MIFSLPHVFRPRARRAGALGLLVFCLAASTALAEVTPRTGPHDNRVRIATWTEGQVYRIVTTLTRVTTVEFGEGETIRSIIAGDTVGFQFDGVPGGRAFAIKPAASGDSFRRKKCLLQTSGE